MGTIAEKLTYLNTTKIKLRDSLNKFGSSILSADTFRSYDTKLNDIYDKLPKVTQSGAGFTLSEVQNGQVDDFKMIGTDLEQNKTNGINKFYLDNNYSANYGEASIEVNNNNSFILRMNKTSSNKQSPCATIEFNASYLKPNTTYTISKKNSNTGYVLEHVGSIRLYTNGSYGNFIDADEYTFTTPNEITSFKILLYLFFGNSTTGNYEITFYDIQLEENSTATNFEPYTGGIPSPNPNYPQEIKVVEGRQVINVKGKNLFDKDNANKLTGFLADGGTFNSTTGYKTLYISCNNSSTYTIQKTSGSFFRVAEFENIPANGDNWITRTKDDNANVITFTTTTGNYLAVTYFKTADTITEQEMLNSIQIEEGTTATDYEPYYNPVSYNIDLNLENIYLAKMPNTDYKNKIYKNNGNWYFEENVKKLILDGTEYWMAVSASDGSRFSCTKIKKSVVIPSSNADVGLIYCDKFSAISSNNTSSSVNGIAIASSGNIVIYYDELKNYDATQFKTWLSNNNLEICYPVTTPTTTQITNTTLINQLEAISVHTGTNIITISNDNNMTPEIEITRLKELERLS